VRITVDTKSDSLDDIKRVISLLQAVAGGQQSYTNYGQSTSAPSYSPMNIFSDDAPSSGGAMAPSQPSVPSSSQAGASADLFTMFSGSSQSTPSSTTAQPTIQPYHDSDDILREVSSKEERPPGDGNDDDDNDGPLGDYEIIPYD